MGFHKIKSVEPLENRTIKVEFINGVSKTYDFNLLIKKIEAFKILENKDVFSNVKVDIGGYGIVWNEKLDLSSEEIWENGIII